ncbi:MAG TPA: CapA family protein [Sandaracinaceae bacterium]
MIVAGSALTLFLAGDVMTGRGIDQVLPHPCDPALREPYVLDAREYVALAEEVSGDIPRPVPPAYPWGDALDELERVAPAARIVNLETSITRSDAFWPGKGVHYRTSPENAECLRAAKLDGCVLANNHVIDFGRAGLVETLETLDRLSIAHAGAGRTIEEATAPAVLDRGELGRVLVFAVGSPSAGVPRAWEAAAGVPGVWLAPDLSGRTVRRIRDAIERHARPRDVVVLSIHWGPNWGYGVGDDERAFARAVIDEAGAHVVHGHSSHHVKGIELYRGRLVLYGCGDLLTDYEGIRGYERFRGDLGLMYFATVDVGTGRLIALEMVPTRMRRFRITRASGDDAAWLGRVMRRECEMLGAEVEQERDGRLFLRGDR